MKVMELTDFKIDTGALSSLLQDLIRIDSVNPDLVPGGRGEGEIARYVGQYLQDLGVPARCQEVAPGRPNVIGVIKGRGGGRTLLLDAHLDTVGTAGMAIAPLTPRVENGRVYGRGSLDDKGGLTAMLLAARSLLPAGVRLKGDVILAAVADEEHASLGTEAVAREYRADAAIVCEPTGLKVCVAHKGFAWARVEFHGRAAHGSLPQEGIDAIIKAGKFLALLEGLEFRWRDRRHPLLGLPSVHASLIQGGQGLSTYPDYCRLDLERRTVPGEDQAIVAAELASLIGELASADPYFKATLDVHTCRPPLEVPPDAAVVRTLIHACERALGRPPELIGQGGWMDSAILAAAGIPSVIFGPGGSGAHAAVEYVDLASVAAAARVLAGAAADFCG